MESKNELVELTAEIVAAYVGNNPVPQSDLPKLIGEVYRSLSGAIGNQEQKKEEPTELKPAIPVRRSVMPDYIICLEDGKKFKSLKRHLRTHYSLTPEQYREKWDLPADYPMVAPNYAQARSTLAKRMGLGRKRASA
jgi:predicted transcriptional regulator